MLDVYHKQVRSVLELAVPVWQPALTQQEVKQIERVQRCALYIIMGDAFTSYRDALETLESENLHERRIKLCEKFAIKTVKEPRYSHWFSLNTTPPPPFKTRLGVQEAKKPPTKFNSVTTRTDRYRDSPLPYLTDVLNNIK